MPATGNTFDPGHLMRALRGVGVDQRPELFDELAAAYGEAGRHYHNATHIAECLALAERFGHLARHRSEVDIALWFHDAVYDTRRSDNEQRSAQWATSYLTAEGCAPGIVSRIAGTIRATQTHGACDDVDAALVVDIDLSILGSDADRFDDYDRAIRMEYDWVPLDDYRIARRRVLQGFLERNSIYQTPAFQAVFERHARQNIARRLKRDHDNSF